MAKLSMMAPPPNMPHTCIGVKSVFFIIQLHKLMEIIGVRATLIWSIKGDKG
jgi:hypothetical protein